MKKLLTLLLVINVLWSVWLYNIPEHETAANFLYNLAYGLNFLIASIACLFYIKKHPPYRNIYIAMFVGSAVFFVAQLIWLYYNLIARTEVPYPGIADLFWLLFYPFIGLGFALIMKRIKINFSLSRVFEIFIIFIAMFSIINSFISINSVQESLPLLTKVLNLTYPFFDSILLALALSTIHSKVGSLQPHILYFVFTFIILAFADTLFAYSTSAESYWNGNYVDLLYAVAGYLFAMGIISLPQLLQANEQKTTLSF
ncbi:MAG: Sensor histidine kinase [Parcubacteria bacterium C7867-005]|nr:MAG: Sensor histidine kinase [Parcubacteria bacterium C7867-005]